MFENTLNSVGIKNQKLTIILGSGFHKNAIGNNSILSNWEILLSKLSNSNSLSKKYTLDFEQIVLNQTGNQDLTDEKQTHEIEKREVKHLANFISAEQKWVLAEKNRFNYPDVFNPKYVCDVISLNFDHIAESLCNMKYGNGETIVWSNESSFSKIYGKNSTSSIYRRTSFRKITDNQGHEIRFWYPHGSILKPDSITLGTNRYAILVSDTIRIKKHYKKHERENNFNQNAVDLTWYSQIIKNPVLILGASVSEAEWGLWSAFIYKRRNFAKSGNKEHEHQIFKMIENYHSEKTQNQNFWFQPLFENKNYKEQWETIENEFNE
ncbi:hypothetical protein [Flavobacterium sp. W22_SRS_FP1]|uniref:hypothetical protein n=1 Tax=Flavobacterium sp. W22_SRS_FP1 TaxID=3240276 RepID=UPI003F906F86